MKKSSLLLFVFLFLLSNTAWGLPTTFLKEDAVDIDKFDQAETIDYGDGTYGTDFSYDPQYTNACGMANAASLLWGAGYRFILDENGDPKIAADEREYFEWTCSYYWDSLHDDQGDSHPGMSLPSQKKYMDDYIGNDDLNDNDEEKPRTRVETKANVENGENVPLTEDQVDSLKSSLVSCSLVSLIIENDTAGRHEVQLVGWKENGEFIIYDPDTDGADWDPYDAKYTFRDEEYWTSSLDSGWELTPEWDEEGGETRPDAYQVIGYKKFFAIPEPGTLYLLMFGLTGLAYRQWGRTKPTRSQRGRTRPIGIIAVIVFWDRKTFIRQTKKEVMQDFI